MPEIFYYLMIKYNTLMKIMIDNFMPDMFWRDILEINENCFYDQTGLKCLLMRSESSFFMNGLQILSVKP